MKWIVILCMICGYLGTLFFSNNHNSSSIPDALTEIPSDFIKSAQNLAMGNLSESTNRFGFIKIPEYTNPSDGKVIVFAPKDCTSVARKRADEMIAGLTQIGIPYEESDKIRLNFRTGTDTFLIRKIEVAVTGEVPVIVVNGWIKANPPLKEVIAIYNEE